MRLIIDAYNVLRSGQSRFLQQLSAHQSRGFINLVARYAHLKHHEAVIVFDGGESFYPTRVTRDGITVVHSGTRLTADDLIKDELQKHPADALILVSNDRELCDAARARSILCLEAHGFAEYMQAALEGRDHERKETVAEVAQKRAGHESEASLDALMEQYSSRVPTKEEDAVGEKGDRKRDARKGSKEERRIERVVKKL